MLAYGEEESPGNVGLGRKRKERNGKMKRRLMRSPIPQGSFAWLQTYIEMLTHTHAPAHALKHRGKSHSKSC